MCDSNNAALKGLKIGKEMQYRIKTGKVPEDRVTNFENEWIKKLELADEAHTKVNNLYVSEADKYVLKFRKFLNQRTPFPCPDYQIQVMSCYEKNKDQPLMCSEEVDLFMSCVDNMLTNTSRRTSTISKKPTYTEKFERMSSS